MGAEARKVGGGSFRTALNMGCIVPSPRLCVVSSPFRFFSVCFALLRMQQWRNICIAAATQGQKAGQIGLARVARAGLMG